MPIFDLHTHSNVSDGILSPEALVSRALQRGVHVLALTDHDTVAGIAAAQSAARREGLRLIAGVEFSSQWKGMGVHIVGLNIDPTHAATLAAQAQQLRVREERAVRIDACLRKSGITGALAGAREQAGAAVLGRPHFARYLLQAGYVDSLEAAFKRYLGAGKPGDVKHLWPHIGEVVEWIRAAGGVPVLAHPNKYKLTRTKLCALAAEFRARGGAAMEVISGNQEAAVTADLARIANQLDLCASCGSDFHGPDQLWHELGAFDSLPPSCRPVWQLWDSH